VLLAVTCALLESRLALDGASSSATGLIKLAAAAAPPLMRAVQITFAVTSKDKKEGGPSRADALRSVLSCVWPYLVWLAGFAAGVGYFIVKACMGAYGPCECHAANHVGLT
jgi:hypothetical protein